MMGEGQENARRPADGCVILGLSGQRQRSAEQGDRRYAGGTLFLETDDCQASYDELSACGVAFNDPPTAQPYGSTPRFATRRAITSA
jgi:uncharacterized protein YgiB involved in biofilm formation